MKTSAERIKRLGRGCHRADKPGDRRQAVQKQNGQITHSSIRPTVVAKAQNAHDFANSPWTGWVAYTAALTNLTAAPSILGGHRLHARLAAGYVTFVAQVAVIVWFLVAASPQSNLTKS